VKVWHVESGQEVLILRGAPPRSWDPGFTPRLAWSPDGRRLAATNWDASVSVWDAADRDAPAAKAALRAAAQGRAFDWHLRNLDASLDAETRFAADFHLRAVTAAEPPSAPQRRARGELYARLGDWRAAADDYAGLFATAPPEDVWTWRRHTLLRLQIGDREGYRHACDRLWEQCRRAGHAPAETNLLRVLALAPVPDGEALALRDWAISVRRSRESDPSTACLAGLAEYRAGRFADAVRACEVAATGSDSSGLVCRAVLAMASQRVGQIQAARKWLDQAEQALRDVTRHSQRPGTAPPDWDWTDWVEIQILLREAASIMRLNQ
jgi:tetratricopeptide (TPR) repeat protein